MNRVYTALTKQDNGWWIGWIEEVSGVNCQERMHEQLLETLNSQRGPGIQSTGRYIRSGNGFS